MVGGVRRADHIDTEIDVGVVLDLRDEVDDQNDLHSNSAGRDNSAGLASFPASLPGGGGFGPSTTGPAMRMHFGSGVAIERTMLSRVCHMLSRVEI